MVDSLEGQTREGFTGVLHSICVDCFGFGPDVLCHEEPEPEEKRDAASRAAGWDVVNELCPECRRDRVGDPGGDGDNPGSLEDL